MLFKYISLVLYILIHNDSIIHYCTVHRGLFWHGGNILSSLFRPRFYFYFHWPRIDLWSVDFKSTSDITSISDRLILPRPLIYWPYVNLWSIDLAINSISDTLILPRPLMCCHIDLWPSAPDLTFNSGVDLTSTSDPLTLTLSRPLDHWPWPYPDLWLCPNLYISSVTFTLPRLYLELWSADHDLT